MGMRQICVNDMLAERVGGRETAGQQDTTLTLSGHCIMVTLRLNFSGASAYCSLVLQ